MKNLFVFIFTLFATGLFSQEYVMFETHYLTPKLGHLLSLNEEITEHNRLFHAKGPYHNTVFSVVNGPRQGDLFFAMGPFTFTQNDNRPNDAKHGMDWASVLPHADEVSGVEYWVRNDDLSINLEPTSGEPMDLQNVRFFDVADDQLFMKVQKQINATIKAMGSKRPRAMFKRQFLHKDGSDWAAVSPYKNWAELDNNSLASFPETFVKVHGEEAFTKFLEEFKQAVISREDEWRMLRSDLMSEEDN